MPDEEFQSIIEDVISHLPEQFKDAMKNIAILIEDEPHDEHYRLANIQSHQLLLGLYQGIPLPKRTSSNSQLPDRITLFKLPILQLHQTPENIRNQIRSTVLHEIGHYFGMSEDAIRDTHH